MNDDKQATAALIAASIMDELHPHILRAITKALEGEVVAPKAIKTTARIQDGKLTDEFINAQSWDENKPSGSKFSDKHGLFIHVKNTGKYWRINYIINGSRKTLSIGVYPKVSLGLARITAGMALSKLQQGEDPSENAKQLRVEAAKEYYKLEAAK